MKDYPAKLLLFGEHTVNAGSQALAVPLPFFSGKWAYSAHLAPGELAARQFQLPQFADYLDQLQQRGELLAMLDMGAFRRALHEGLFFESNIPTGYGAGSSGALVAAVFDSWQLAVGRSCPDASGWQSDLGELKKALAQMEAFFHGTSSGTDPLICFLQKAVLLGGQAGGVRLVELPKNFHWKVDVQLTPKVSHQIFLLDTGKARNATDFIAYFLQKMKGYRFSSRCENSFNAEVNDAIQAFLDGDGMRLFMQVHAIGGFQLQFLPKLVPQNIRPIWLEGLEGDLFKLKVCGAGGGGFLLGITKDFEAVRAAIPGYRLLHVADI